MATPTKWNKMKTKLLGVKTQTKKRIERIRSRLGLSCHRVQKKRVMEWTKKTFSQLSQILNGISRFTRSPTLSASLSAARTLATLFPRDGPGSTSPVPLVSSLAANVLKAAGLNSEDFAPKKK